MPVSTELCPDERDVHCGLSLLLGKGIGFVLGNRNKRALSLSRGDVHCEFLGWNSLCSWGRELGLYRETGIKGPLV